MGERRTLSDFVILYRTNAQSRLFEEALISREIPYQIIGGLRFYERREIKDVLAYLSLIQNPDDIVSLSRIINVPPRGIGEKTLEKIIRLGKGAQDEIPKYGEFSKELDELRQFNAESPPLDELIEKIMKATGYREYLADGTVESEGRLENIEELKNAAASYSDLSSFLESVSLVSDVDEMKDKKSVLTLMTVHCAKGLEFPVVFISGLEEGLFPHSRSLDDAYGLEEERRLFYVGMTRAMERLYISWAQTRSIYGRVEPCAPSRFLDELPKEKIEQIEL
jgi:DNA helicase-2/ATP-dependent DNA helicase PcrA